MQERLPVGVHEHIPSLRSALMRRRFTRYAQPRTIPRPMGTKPARVPIEGSARMYRSKEPFGASGKASQ